MDAPRAVAAAGVFWQSQLLPTVEDDPLDKSELRKLQGFLREAFGNEDIRVTQGKRNPDDADVQFGQRQIGAIMVDDEDGDRSFAFEMPIPV
jgi:hypothetical protein